MFCKIQLRIIFWLSISLFIQHQFSLVTSQRLSDRTTNGARSSLTSQLLSSGRRFSGIERLFHILRSLPRRLVRNIFESLNLDQPESSLNNSPRTGVRSARTNVQEQNGLQNIESRRSFDERGRSGVATTGTRSRLRSFLPNGIRSFEARESRNGEILRNNRLTPLQISRILLSRRHRGERIRDRMRSIQANTPQKPRCLYMLKFTNPSTIPRNHPPEASIGAGSAPGHKHDTFSYDLTDHTGPESWPQIWPKCGRPFQSPININNTQLTGGQPYQISYNEEYRSMRGDLVNNGHSPTFYFDNKDRLLFGAPGLPNEVYVMDQLHFHFSDRFESGSEHAIDGIRFPVELHLVHYNRKYGDFKNSTGLWDGVLVIGVFMQVGMGPPGDLDRFIQRYMGSVQKPDVKGVKASLNPSVTIPFDRSFYTYVGSLTTPPCSGNVRWILMRTHKSISLESYNLLRSLRDNHGERIARFGNSRPVQDVGCRTVETTF